MAIKYPLSYRDIGVWAAPPSLSISTFLGFPRLPPLIKGTSLARRGKSHFLKGSFKKKNPHVFSLRWGSQMCAFVCVCVVWVCLHPHI